MSDAELIAQLIEIGASRPQARAALRAAKGDIGEAMSAVFDGRFADAVDEGEDAAPAAKGGRLQTPDEDEDEIAEDSDEEMMDGSDAEPDDDVFQDDAISIGGWEDGTTKDSDPYAGIFFSKSRKEEVIEIDETPARELLPDPERPGPEVEVEVLTQGEWMKGVAEGSEQSFLFSLYNELTQGTVPCPHCKHPVERKASNFFAIFPDSNFTAYIAHLKQIVHRRCKKCQGTFCCACGESYGAGSSAPSGVSTPSGDGYKIGKMRDGAESRLFHCANLQGVILGVGLAMLERLFAVEREEAPGETAEKSKKKRKVGSTGAAQATDEDDDMSDGYGVPRGNRAKAGTGYAGGSGREDNSGQVAALQKQAARDKKMANLLAAVREFLPLLRRDPAGYPSDFFPHPTTLAHLRRRFNPIASELLRNDSLLDMSERKELYGELVQWLETFADHEALCSIVAQPIMKVSKVTYTSSAASRSQKTRKTVPDRREKTIVYEGSAGPRELLEGIRTQTVAAKKGLAMGVVKGTDPDDPNRPAEDQPALEPENQMLLAFCDRIISAADAIDRYLAKNKGADFVRRLLGHEAAANAAAAAGLAPISAGGAPSSDEELKHKYVEWATSTRFEYVDLEIPSSAPVAAADAKGKAPAPPPTQYMHVFSKEIAALGDSQIPKRSIAIAKELGVLATNVPVAWDSSVFVRVDENRVDVIKFLIIGPEGTPYENGCFIFDCFLGASYNQSPPMVKTMTTKGGRYRYNPNLYSDGKVCLSLLGTWQGPGWVPGKSTLLQVIISIQSMVMNDEPYLNEPGWTSGGGTPASKAYSANTRRMTINDAILGNLKNPPAPFQDVIRTHFKLKAKSIKVQLDKWLVMDDGNLISPEAMGNHQRDSRPAEERQIHKDVVELKRLLSMLERGESIEGQPGVGNAGSSSA